jgi:cytosine/adenosine deaminase-related metal-dependent hydrolase
LVGQGGGLVWCPASNLFTLGATADVRDVAGTGKAALGSDSRLSGERDLLAEMRVALQTGQVDARTIFRMVTCDAASILRLPQAGRLAIGAPADLAIFPAQRADAFESIACAGRADVRLVMIDGRAVFGDADMQPVFAATRTAAECVQLDGRHKLLARRWVDRLRRASIGEPGLEIDA